MKSEGPVRTATYTLSSPSLSEPRQSQNGHNASPEAAVMGVICKVYPTRPSTSEAIKYRNRNQWYARNAKEIEKKSQLKEEKKLPFLFP